MDMSPLQAKEVLESDLVYDDERLLSALYSYKYHLYRKKFLARVHLDSIFIKRYRKYFMRVIVKHNNQASKNISEAVINSGRRRKRRYTHNPFKNGAKIENFF